MDVNLRHTFERAFDGNRGQFVGASGTEGTLKGAPDGSANGRCDDDFSHSNFRPELVFAANVLAVKVEKSSVNRIIHARDERRLLRAQEECE